MSIKQRKIAEQKALVERLEGDLFRAQARLTKAKTVVHRVKIDVRDTKKQIAEAQEWLAALTEVSVEVIDDDVSSE